MLLPSVRLDVDQLLVTGRAVHWGDESGRDTRALAVGRACDLTSDLNWTAFRSVIDLRSTLDCISVSI
jgi:hypothetical protein